MRTISRKKPKIALAIGTVALVLSAGLYLGFVQLKKAPQAPAPAKVPSHILNLKADAPQQSFLRTDKVALSPTPLSEPLNGKIALAEDLTARVFTPVAGRVLELKVAAGDEVRQGQTLAVIDAPEFGQAASDYQKALIDLEQKKRIGMRAQTLYDGEAIAKKDLESAQTDVRASEAEANRARLRLANLSKELHASTERLVLRAPLNGVIVDRKANPGTEVRPDADTPLFVVSDLSRVWLTVDLPERLLGGVKKGDTLTFTVDAYPDKVFSAAVEKIGAVVDPVTRRIPVRATLDNRRGELKPDMYALVNVITQSDEKVLRLPVTALLTQGLKTKIFVKTSPDTFELRDVFVVRQDVRHVYLKPGIGVKDGDEVVIRGALLLASELNQGE